jgi:trans-aconitate 2-methyltransferase
MLARAAPYESDRLSFVEGDIGTYESPADLLFSNAALHWLDDHESLIPRLARFVNPGGVLAVQMPSNFDQPSHKLMEETAFNGPWSGKLKDWKQLYVHPLRWYVNLLQSQGFRVDAWETIYYFQLQGEDPVLEWVKGTSLQPIMTRLEGDDWEAFRSQYAAALRQAYPATPAGTLFPFKRIFFIASRD